MKRRWRVFFWVFASLVYLSQGPSYAATYDSGTGILFVPDITVGTTHYVVTLLKGEGWVFTLQKATRVDATGNSATADYDASTGTLTVSSIVLNNDTYDVSLQKGDGWVFTLGSASKTTNQGASSFDGTWALSYEMTSGPLPDCPVPYAGTGTIQVSGNAITGTFGSPAITINGTVTNTGDAYGIGMDVETAYNWDGSILGGSGSGRWQDSDGCRGTWNISKQ